MKQCHLVSLMNDAPSGARGQIHKAGCRDVEKRIKKGDVANIVQAESPEALVAAELAKDLGERGYSLEDFDILPCCADAENAENELKTTFV